MRSQMPPKRICSRAGRVRLLPALVSEIAHRARDVMLCLWMAFVAACAVRADSQLQTSDGPGRMDVLCGPRCADFVLDFLHRPNPGIASLAKEMAPPDHMPGTTFDAIKTAIERRGVHTAALKIPADAVISWPYPVIAHLKSNRFPDGHFCIWLPSSSWWQVHVWLAKPGTVATIWDESTFAAERSGYVLLTSPDPIIDPERAVAFPVLRALTIGILGFTAAALAIHLAWKHIGLSRKKILCGVFKS